MPEAITCGSDLGVQHTKWMKLYRDSQYALYIAKNPMLHERTKYIATLFMM